jgi:hypothetical protein
MKMLATLAALTALAVAPSAAHAQIAPGMAGVTSAEPNGIIAILIGYTAPIGSNKGSFTPPIGSNKGSVIAP